MGKYRQALEAYQTVENLITTHTAGGPLRPACGLDKSQPRKRPRGRKAGPTWLAQAPAAVTKPIPGEAQLRELEALVRTGRAAECRGSGRARWSEWVKIAVPLGAPTDLQAYGVPGNRQHVAARRIQSGAR